MLETGNRIRINCGANGVISEIEREGKSFILKDTLGKNCKKEVKYQKLAADYGLAPRVIEEGECQFIMERAGDIDMLGYFKLLQKENKEEDVLEFIYLIIAFHFGIKCLNTLGIYHGDTHLGNMMVRLDKDANPMFIDFGLACTHLDLLERLQKVDLGSKSLKGYYQVMSAVKSVWALANCDLEIFYKGTNSVSECMSASEGTTLGIGLKFCVETLYELEKNSESGAGIATYVPCGDPKSQIEEDMEGILFMCEGLEECDFAYSEDRLREVLENMRDRVFQKI